MKQNNARETALHVACGRASVKTVHVLINGLECETMRDGESTQRKIKIRGVERIGVNVVERTVTMKDMAGQTPLHHAAGVRLCSAFSLVPGASLVNSAVNVFGRG